MAKRPRRLSAILHADLAGYVRLMEGGEERTVDRLQSVRAEIWRPTIEGGGGWVVNIEGDSVLAEFGSAAAAVATAIDIQERLALFNAMLDKDERLMFRIGLHFCEVIVDEKTRSIFGDGVNVAARIQAMAEPGGIAVSRTLRDVAEVRADYAVIDGGEHRAKNVSRPLQLYHVRPRSGAAFNPVVRSAIGSVLARVARLGHGARLTIRGPALWGAAATVVLLLAAGGYFAHRVDTPVTVSAVALSLSAEQLEQALAERRIADAVALEKRQLEVEARQKVVVGAEAKRQAEAELERARWARQNAEDDLAKLKADIEARRQADETARRKAEDEAAGLRQAEEEAKKKAAVDAEAKRQADVALAKAEAERQRAEREAQQKAEAEQVALRRASEEPASAMLARQKEESEAAERRLRLDQTARARLQVALTSLGFDTRGSDGIFGPRTRDMIVAWQKARRHAPTGFVTASLQQALLKEGTTAVSKYDEQNHVDEEARTRGAVSTSPPLVALPVSASPSETAAGAQYDGSYEAIVQSTRLRVSLLIANGRGVGVLSVPGCQESRFVASVSAMGAISGEVDFNCVATVGGSTIPAGLFKITGEYQRGAIRLDFRSQRSSFRTQLAAAVSPPMASAPAVAPADGVWRGEYSCSAAIGSSISASNNAPPFTIPLELRVSNGSAIWKSTRSWAVADGGTLEIRLVVNGNSVSVTRSYGMGLTAQGNLSGHYGGNAIRAAGREQGTGVRECKVALTRS